MQQYAIRPADVDLLAHATTVVTNAILEEKGARAALVTTRGFRDVLELRRSSRPDLYDLFQDAPATLIPRRRRHEISERIGADGRLVLPLAEEEIADLIAQLRADRVEAIAVSLLFSFLNPEHEARLGRHLRQAFPHTPIYLSSEVLPEIREFERTSTTAVCAYVGPILSSYLSAPAACDARAGAAAAFMSWGRTVACSKLARASPCRPSPWSRAGRRRGGSGSRRPANRPAEPPVLRHGRHHGQGEPDSRRTVRDDAGI